MGTGGCGEKSSNKTSAQDPSFSFETARCRKQSISRTNDDSSSLGAGAAINQASTLQRTPNVQITGVMPIDTTTDRGGGGIHTRIQQDSNSYTFWSNIITRGMDRVRSFISRGRRVHPLASVDEDSRRQPSARQRRSQARQDRYLARAEDERKKRKSRHFLYGKKLFKKKLTPTHSELRDGIKLGDANITEDTIETKNKPSDMEIRKGHDTELREMHSLMELLKEGGVGFIDQEKRPGWIRILLRISIASGSARNPVRYAD